MFDRNKVKMFYYQIKGKDESGFMGNWSWPPVFSGMVEAENKKKAKLLIDDEYGRKFPLRVLKKDIDEHHYLLNIKEVNEGDERTIGLFELIECEQCNKKFRVIDKYNDFNENDKGRDFCSQSCKSRWYESNKTIKIPSNELSNGIAFIYQIKNKITGMSYIGKTTQVFTLRWYQHFYQHGDCKFHKAIKESKFSDWTFSVIEIVQNIDGEVNGETVKRREGYWISEFDSINNGYNSVQA